MYIDFRVHGSGVRVEGWGLGFGVTCPVSSPPAPEQTRQADPAQGPAVLLSSSWSLRSQKERELLIDNLLVRIHFIIEMIWWTGLAPWEFEFSFQVALHLPS